MNRREFITSVLAVGATAGIERFTQAAGLEKKTNRGELKECGFREISAEPEYRKRLDRALVIIPEEGYRSEKGEYRIFPPVDVPEDDPEIAALLNDFSAPEKRAEYRAELEEMKEIFYASFAGLLSNLPAHTQLDVVCKKRNEPYVRRLMESHGVKHTIRLVSDFKADDHDIKHGAEPFASRFAQDFCWSVNSGSESALLVSAVAPQDYETYRRVKTITEAFPDTALRQARFVFKKGNIFFDEIGGKKKVFVGYDILLDTLELPKYATLKKQVVKDTIPPAITEELKKEIASHFKDQVEVVVIGTERQDHSNERPKIRHRTFHIDQSMVPLGNGKVAVLDLQAAEPPESAQPLYKGFDREEFTYLRSYHQQLAAQMKALGYEVVAVPVTDDVYLARFQSPMNVVPYFNGAKQCQEVLLPVYVPDMPAHHESQKIAVQDLTGMAKQTSDIFLQNGYAPVPVADPFGPTNKGSLHCTLNVLS